MNCQPNTARNFGFTPARLFTLADALFPEFRSTAAPATRTWSPPVEVTEDAGQYTITADVADVKPEEVKVSLLDGVLTLKGERKQDAKPEDVRTHLSEIRYGAFQRQFSLPKDANPEAVSASYKNGLLTVSVGKKAETQSKEITVKAA